MQLIGQIFHEFRSRAFFLDGELICSCLVMFFRISDNQWIALTIGEGSVEFKLTQSEPNIISLIEIDDNFAYPQANVEELGCYIGRQIISVYDYRLKSDPNECVGVYFNCGDKGFSVLENDDCLSIIDGKADQFMDFLELSVNTSEIILSD